MKKRLIIGTFVVIITGVGLGLAYFQASYTASQQNAEVPQKTNTTSKPVSPAPASQSGAYTEYSDTVIADTRGTKILFFHAPWCPQCRSLDSSIKSTELPDGLTIIKVDYDSNQQLRQRYGVTLQTTFVEVDDAGNLIEKYVAYNEPVYASVKTNLID